MCCFLGSSDSTTGQVSAVMWVQGLRAVTQVHDVKKENGFVKFYEDIFNGQHHK